MLLGEHHTQGLVAYVPMVCQQRLCFFSTPGCLASHAHPRLVALLPLDPCAFSRPFCSGHPFCLPHVALHVSSCAGHTKCWPAARLAMCDHVSLREFQRASVLLELKLDRLAESLAGGVIGRLRTAEAGYDTGAVCDAWRMKDMPADQRPESSTATCCCL